MRISRSAFTAAHRRGNRGLLFTFVLVLGSLAACGTSAASQPTATTPPTATSTPVNPCPGGNDQPLMDQFTAQHILFPPNSIVTDKGFSANDTGTGHGSYTLQLAGVCTPAMTPNQVESYYAANMLAQGWSQSATFPTQSSASSPCGDPYCWKRDGGNNITLYLALQSVQALSTAATYAVDNLDYNN
jgi:hypothetical protein